MGMSIERWRPERENLAGEARNPPNAGNESFQASERYRDLLSIRAKLKIEMAEVEREIAEFEREMVS